MPQNGYLPSDAAPAAMSDPSSSEFRWARRVDFAVEYLLVALLALAAMACGAIGAWAEEAVVLLAGAMLLCVLLKVLVSPGGTLVRSWTLLPLGVFLLLVIFQLLPLPVGWGEIFSPNTVLLRRELLSDLPDGIGASTWTSLSLYSLATQRQLRLALSVAAVFVAVLNTYRQEDQIRRLLIAVCFLGVAAALLQLAHVASGTERVLWVGIMPRPGHVVLGGPFGGSHGGFSQFMNLCLGAAVGMLTLHWMRDWQAVGFRPSDYLKDASSRRTRRLWLLITVLLLGAASIFASRSRGGVLGMVTAGSAVVLLTLLHRRFRRVAWALSLVVVGVLICLLYVGLDVVWDRLATLGEFSVAYRLRWRILQDVFAVWQRFPVFGTGLGTHEMVFPMFSGAEITATITHAENEYAQLLEETGLLGLGCILSFGVMILISAVRCIRRPRPPIRIVAVGLAFGLFAVAIHSLSDFGLHKPANACLAATFCALLVVLARMDRSVPARPPGGAARRRRWAGVALVCVLGVWGWCAYGADRARRAEAYWREAETLREGIRREGWAATNPQYAQLILAADQARQRQPDNVEYRFWLNYFRWRSLSRIRLDSSGAIFVPAESMEHVRRIVADLMQARKLCPMYSPPVSLAGELELSVLGRPEQGAALIRKGQKLRPSDPIANYAVGVLDALEGRPEESLQWFTKAVRVDSGLFPEAVGFYLMQLDRPQLAIRLAGEDLARLRNVARRLEQRPEYAALAKQTNAQILEHIRHTAPEADVPTWQLIMLADDYRMQKQYDEAIRYYRRALDVHYDNTYCRLYLAQALADSGRLTEAIDEVQLCLKLHPGLSSAEKLLDTLRDRQIRAGDSHGD